VNIYTAERTNENSVSDNPIFQRHLFAYENAVKYIKGEVLEVGCGEGYGSKLLAPHAKKYTAIDKFKAGNEHNLQGIEFIQMNVPYLKPFADNAFDVVISFQVIEHVQRDDIFVQEIWRVLKPGGVLVCTTPNIKMSLSRNPYHVREYTVGQLAGLMGKSFGSVETLGVFCDQKAMDYFERNRASVKKFTRFDVFNLQYNLPRWALKIPYDVLNRMNRLRLKKENNELVSEITTANFTLKRADDGCVDLFYVGKK
jgi:2-polyprenyl-3-methyl-5-hydroxy-6-metoxy-1,4-benzoquinol methylase